MPFSLEIIGDEIRFNGILVAIVVPSSTPSIVGAFEDFIRDPVDALDLPTTVDVCEEIAKQTQLSAQAILQKIRVAAEKSTRGGLLKASALATILDRIEKDAQ